VIINTPGSDGPTKACRGFSVIINSLASEVFSAEKLGSFKSRATRPSEVKVWRWMALADQVGKQNWRAGFCVWDSLDSSAKQTAAACSLPEPFYFPGIKFTLYKW
jgi:hypothetical protein